MNDKKNEELKMIVEITKNSVNKYEFDGKIWNLDRVLYGAIHYPEEYGFIPETLGFDGDCLDVLCINNFSTFSGCFMPIRIIGVLKMIDNEESDDKLIAVNSADPRLNNINDLKDIGENKLEEIIHFFINYKKGTKVNGFEGKKEAMNIIAECKKRYKEKIIR